MMREKSKISVFKNFTYSLKIIFSADKRILIMRVLLLFTSLASSLYIAYENKLFLDTFESKEGIDVIVLIILGIVILGLLISSINLIVGHICSYLLNIKLCYKLYLKSFAPLFSAD